MSLDVHLEMKLDTGNEEYVADLFNANVTHNLGEMASECGLYNPLWRPYRLFNVTDDEAYEGTREDDMNILAEDIVDALKKGLEILLSDPKKYKQFNPSNGWGTYEGLVKMTTNYIEACDKYPKARVRTCR